MREAVPAGLGPCVCGAVAGSAMKLIDHPFDTIKTRMQASQTRYASTASCFTSTMRTDGVSGLYRGLPPALIASVTTSALRMTVQSRFNSWLARRIAGPATTFERLPATSRVLAEAGGGAACGLVLPLIFTPLELVKVRRQVVVGAGGGSVGSLQVLRGVLAERGVRGLYVGHTLTMARSTMGNATLFGSYEGWRCVLARALGSDERARTVQVCAGVLSGWCSQLVCYPIDAAKSRAQARLGSASGGAAVGLLPGLRELWREGTMYRGVSTMLLRAVPVHMVYLPLYSQLLQWSRDRGI